VKETLGVCATRQLLRSVGKGPKELAASDLTITFLQSLIDQETLNYFSQEETDSEDIIAANHKEKDIARQVKQYEDFLHKNNEAQLTLVAVQSERDAVVKKLDEQTSIAKQMRAQRETMH
jgi:hypothetical protein